MFAFSFATLNITEKLCERFQAFFFIFKNYLNTDVKMEVLRYMDKIININKEINDFLWEDFGLYLLLAVGLITTLITGFFQVIHIRHWWKTTIGSVFKKGGTSTAKTDKKSISQFQALCTALAATVGTGNIAGVSAAICTGGPGAVLWMWIASFLGMMTNFSENVLGIYFRQKNENGEWSGGAMYYLKNGVGKIKGLKIFANVLAVLFAFFTILASFGIGNMGQINKIVLNVNSAFIGESSKEVFGTPIENIIIGLVLTILGALIILGGLQRIARFAEFVIPFMAIGYLVFGIIVIGVNYESIIPAFKCIFKYAFGVDAVAGGVVGITLKEAITQGCKRGVFSNEAGLGSSVIVHSSSNVKEPVKQGMWGIFEVFFDTIVVCTTTALIALTSGYIDLNTGLTVGNVNDATLINKAFGKVFGSFGEGFIAVAMLFFAFTTVLGWSQYGTKAVEYIFGIKASKIYKVIFVLMIISGAVMTSSLAWDISDTFNGLMMIPNLIAVIILCPLVKKITVNYIRRKLKGSSEKPMLSYDEEIQALAESSISDDIIILPYENQ